MTDVTDGIDGVGKEAVAVQARLTGFLQRVEALQVVHQDATRQLESARREVEDLQGAQRVLQEVAERLAVENETVTARLGTLALRDTFYDQDLSLRVDHTVVRGQAATGLRLWDEVRQVEGEVLDSFGGGPAALLSVLLRVLTVLRQAHLKRILILDEPLVQVSAQYQERAARLLRKLCESIEQGGLGFTMLVVTHSPLIQDAAHRFYQAEVAADGVGLRLQTGESS